jgi:hypothetical protein
MGHLRLGTLPDTAPWRRVVGLIADAADVSTIAGATIDAARKGLDKARIDAGLAYCYWLLTQTVLAARQPDFSVALGKAGIRTAADPSIFDIVASFSDAVDTHLRTSGGRTDFGEMALLACVGSLTELLGRRSVNLFGTTSVEVKQAARELSTRDGFATLAHDFFARFTFRFLGYHLGRELSQHVGGNGRFPDPGEHNAFTENLETHCREAALIVKDFAGAWYSKHNFEEGITPRKARGFVTHALDKLGSELQRRGARGGA